jgi:hypothetical protein
MSPGHPRNRVSSVGMTAMRTPIALRRKDARDAILGIVDRGIPIT